MVNNLVLGKKDKVRIMGRLMITRQLLKKTQSEENGRFMATRQLLKYSAKKTVRIKWEG